MRSNGLPEDSVRESVRIRSVLVLVGIFLFVAGFIVTLDALPSEADALGNSSVPYSAPSTVLVIGFAASLAGVGLATIGPAVMFMRARRAKA